jgi:uncharacterized Zn ribbon protein
MDKQRTKIKSFKMKKIAKLLTFILGIALLFTACEDMKDIHGEYLEDGDHIYAPKPLDIKGAAGRGRVMLKYDLKNATNINKCIIEWNEGESKTVDLTPKLPLDSVEIVIDDLEEKSYLFKVYTTDDKDNRSVKMDVAVASYGTRYESSLSNRTLTGMEGGGTTDSVVISWAPAPDGNLGVNLFYNNSAGETATKHVLPEDDYTVIKDWESEGEITYHSLFIPEEFAIDTFVSPTDSKFLPVLIDFQGEKMEKTNWEIVDLSSEEPAEGAPNGLASAAIDDDLSTFWHSQWNADTPPDYPHHFTIDLKGVAKLNKFECYRRQGDGRSQTEFQIHTSLDGVNFTNQGTFNYDPNSASQTYNLNNLPMARYVKYVATKGPEYFAFLAELDLYGQMSTQIDRSSWTVDDFSSEEPNEGAPNGLVTAIIDNDVSTFWHTNWSSTKPIYPHHFTFDMQEDVNILAIGCNRRQGNSYGQTKFKIYTSDDGVNFDDQGTFDFNSKIDEEQIFALGFLPTARYIKYEAIEGPEYYAFLSEFYVYGSVDD